MLLGWKSGPRERYVNTGRSILSLTLIWLTLILTVPPTAWVGWYKICKIGWVSSLESGNVFFKNLSQANQVRSCDEPRCNQLLLVGDLTAQWKHFSESLEWTSRGIIKLLDSSSQCFSYQGQDGSQEVISSLDEWVETTLSIICGQDQPIQVLLVWENIHIQWNPLNESLGFQCLHIFDD